MSTWIPSWKRNFILVVTLTGWGEGSKSYINFGTNHETSRPSPKKTLPSSPTNYHIPLPRSRRLDFFSPWKPQEQLGEAGLMVTAEAPEGGGSLKHGGGEIHGGGKRWEFVGTWTLWKLKFKWAVKKPSCLGHIGDYTTQLYRDYNKPL